MKKKHVTIIAACAVVVIAAATLMGSANQGGAAAEQVEISTVIPVATISPDMGNIALTGEYVATVEAGQQVTIYPKAAGEVLSVNYNVGDTVSAGDVLLEIDSRTIRNNIAQTQASLNSARAQADLSLEIAERSKDNYEYNVENGYEANLIQAESAVKNAQASVDALKQNVWNTRQDIRDLENDKLQVPDSTTFDTYISELRRALTQYEIQLASAEAGLATAEEALRATQKAVAEGRDSYSDNVRMAEIGSDMSQLQLSLQAMQDTLSDYSVKSPISGVIEKRSIEPFNMASSAAPVFVISNKDSMTVAFKVPESSLGYISVGDSITVDKNGETWPGTITQVSTMVEQGSGLFAVEAMVENAPFSLHTGSTIKVYVDTQKANDTMLIPIDALYYDSGEPFVYIARDGVAVKTFVETGISNDQNIQILSGLGRDDAIIITWHTNLEDGAEIRFTDAADSLLDDEEAAAE